METSVLVTTPETLNEEDKSALREAGVVVIEAENPDNVRLLKPCAELSGDDLLYAAMKAIRESTTTTRSDFAKYTASLIISARVSEE